MTPDPSSRSNGPPPTLREIADQAGVHISTASRVLRQPEPADGWSDSALRVRQVAEELGYQPNLWAASLRTRKTTTIGVVMRSEEHTSELQSLMRISYAVLCLTTKKIDTTQICTRVTS